MRESFLLQRQTQQCRLFLSLSVLRGNTEAFSARQRQFIILFRQDVVNLKHVNQDHMNMDMDLENLKTCVHSAGTTSTVLSSSTRSEISTMVVTGNASIALL